MASNFLESSFVYLTLCNLLQLDARNKTDQYLLNYPVRLLPHHWRGIKKDKEYVTCLRSCLMKPEHKDWVEDIWKIVLSSS